MGCGSSRVSDPSSVGDQQQNGWAGEAEKDVQQDVDVPQIETRYDIIPERRCGSTHNPIQVQGIQKLQHVPLLQAVDVTPIETRYELLPVRRCGSTHKPIHIQEIQQVQDVPRLQSVDVAPIITRYELLPERRCGSTHRPVQIQDVRHVQHVPLLKLIELKPICTENEGDTTECLETEDIAAASTRPNGNREVPNDTTNVRLKNDSEVGHRKDDSLVREIEGGIQDSTDEDRRAGGRVLGNSAHDANPTPVKDESSRINDDVIGQPVWRHDYDLPFVDPDEGLGDSPDIYRRLKQPIKIEDTFWSGKRALIPNFDEMRRIDNHAKKAPEEIARDISKLVKYLIEPTVDDLQKYRSIARWIAENIAYEVDVYYKRKERPSGDSETVLKNRSAVCGGYSGLFEAMCHEAGLQCETISGHSKGVGYIPGGKKYGAHAWNQITIDGRKFLCDVTWAAGGIGSDQKFSKNWKEHEFLGHPGLFNTSRLPKGEGDTVDEKLQHGDIRYSSLTSWGDTPYYGFMMYATGASISPLSSTSGTISSLDNTGEIRIDIPRLVEVKVTLEKLPQRKEIDAGFVMVSWEGTTAVFRYCLPGPGDYVFRILSRFAMTADEETEGLYGVIVSYRIQGKGTEIHTPVKIDGGYYGNSPYGYCLGYQCLTHSDPIIETTESRILFQFAYPEWGKAFFRLSTHRGKTTDTGYDKVDNSIFTDSLPRKHVCYVHLPKTGKYLLQQLTTRASNQDKYHITSNFVINFEGKSPAIPSPFPAHNDWGQRPLFQESWLTALNSDGSTIRMNGGKGVLKLSRPLSANGDLLANVVTMEEKSPPEASSWVNIVTEEEKEEEENLKADGTKRESVFLSIPKPGFYAMNLFVDLKFAGRFLIANDGVK